MQPVPGRVQPGDSFDFEVGLHDPAMPVPVTERLTVRIAGEAVDTPPTKAPKKPQKREKRRSKS